MHQAVVHLHPAGPRVALVGNPNCGKTALFNRLTGSRQKVANYAGVTVERKEGQMPLPDGRSLRVLDLPGAYSLHPRSPDERVTRDVLFGHAAGERRPELVVCVLDATQLRRGLRLVLAVQRLGLPCIVALNMTDLAARRGLQVDADALARELGVPVLPTVAVQAGGDAALRARLADRAAWPAAAAASGADAGGTPEADHLRVRAILQRLGLDASQPPDPSERIDRVLLHPLAGPLLLVLLLFAMFQAVFSLAEAPMGWIEAGTAALADAVAGTLPAGAWRSFVVDGLVAGLGGVLVFLPQILILFAFILVLEESGYLPRAAFLLDRLMGGVGLSGRSFIPLLSSFACAIPGIMATRTIADRRDRLVTILIAPLMTCSARLPVYALLIAAFVPAASVGPGLSLQGLVLFALYGLGVAGGMAVAWVLKRFTAAGRQPRPLMMELPAYLWPSPRNLVLGLWQRALIFVRRVGGIILVLTVALWALSSFPAPPAGATEPAIAYSVAGRLGQALAVVLEPVGFNWQIAVALVPALAAREVVVSALGTVYALSATGDDSATLLAPLIAGQWSLATGLALLAWFVFAPQCLATLAAARRETGSWGVPALMAGYLLALAYVAAFVTYRVTLALGG